ncbi:SMI1/KNR4 family protein [Superficieibacter electus]|uniref:SMI1/KNR4 family protein n=1 Tax=Superficieibacter electus TaxID=2022662 RepID=A0A2P5GT27_9ENTR|nr:SMI1/KNR4 family protein [Superficieibacter electus]POP46237.1 SMI1/KNR4 family protein [Superficieibacter electus]POP49707.1 SMI1/KNR4 family protein [Superficieibacter electus]
MLSAQLNEWHQAGQNRHICEAIEALPAEERSDELICLQARALNNLSQHREALATLESIRTTYADNPWFCLRYGIALFELNREDESIAWFVRAQEGGLEEIDETPGPYAPKTLSKWLTFARRRGPQRLEKNAFEAQLRAQTRVTTPADADYSHFDFTDFWDDCEYSQQSYIGATPTDEEIAEVETELGYRLPEAYKALIKIHNGGLLTRNGFENPLQRDWASPGFAVESLYGVDRTRHYSLCGEMGSQFWLDEWGYPAIGVAIADGISGGHDMIFLDYSDCGPQGEPCVVHIAQESGYEITWLAGNFRDFINGLLPPEEMEEI